MQTVLFSELALRRSPHTCYLDCVSLQGGIVPATFGLFFLLQRVLALEEGLATH